jgi:hypothetical protein
MSDSIKTGLFVGVAAVLVIAALITTPRLVPSDRFEDEGELFFPGFTDPAQAVSLEIHSVDESAATASIFKVHRKDGRWTIPSHYDYAADAKDRMAKAAGMLIGLRKGAVRSDSRADHAALGVVDPLDAEAGLEGRGLLVNFRGEGDRELGRLILGKEVEGRPGQRYVRVPGKRRTYAATVAADVSTKFADWVETDLLKLSAWDVTTLLFDNYSVDEEAGEVRQGERVVAKKDDGGAWTVEGTSEEEEADAEKLDEAGRALDDLKIVGVRPKPPGLTARLELERGADADLIVRSLTGRGFFPYRGRLYANEGDLHVTTKDGIRYTLRFGEILYGNADETAGSEEPAEGEERSEGEEGAEEGEKKRGRPNRYLMVTVNLDPDGLKRPEGAEISEDEATKVREAIREIEDIVAKIEEKRGEGGELPDPLSDAVGDDETLAADPWDRQYVLVKTEDGFRVSSLGRDGETGGEGADADLVSDALEEARGRLLTAREIREHAEKVEKAGERLEELQERFAPWYYVIDADLYDKLKLSRADAVKAKEPEEPEEPEMPEVPGEVDREATPSGGGPAEPEDGGGEPPPPPEEGGKEKEAGEETPRKEGGEEEGSGEGSSTETPEKPEEPKSGEGE